MVQILNRPIVTFIQEYHLRMNTLFTTLSFQLVLWWECFSISCNNGQSICMPYPRKFANRSDVRMDYRSQWEVSLRFVLADFFLNLYYHYEFNGQKVPVQVLAAILWVNQQCIYRKVDNIMYKMFMKHIEKFDIDKNVEKEIKNNKNKAARFISEQLELWL